MENTSFDRIVSLCKKNNKIHIKYTSGGEGFSIAVNDITFNLTEWELIADEKGILLVNRENPSVARFFPISIILEITSI